MGQTVLDTDAFTNTAGTVLHTHNAKWRDQGFLNPCNIATSGTACGGLNNAVQVNTGATWTNDQWAEFTIVAFPLGGFAWSPQQRTEFC